MKPGLNCPSWQFLALKNAQNVNLTVYIRWK